MAIEKNIRFELVKEAETAYKAMQEANENFRLIAYNLLPEFGDVVEDLGIMIAKAEDSAEWLLKEMNRRKQPKKLIRKVAKNGD